jgi:hypothetical protein
MSAREYRKQQGLPTSRGIITAAKREELRTLNKKHNAHDNLTDSGIATRYTKGDPRTKQKKSYWVGRKRPNTPICE